MAIEIEDDLRFKVLEGLEPHEISAFFNLRSQRTYPDGTCLFKEKTAANKFYLVQRMYRVAV